MLKKNKTINKLQVSEMLNICGDRKYRLFHYPYPIPPPLTGGHEVEAKPTAEGGWGKAINSKNEIQPKCSCSNLPQYTSGFTLIELVVAIALSTPVLFLIFFYLTDMENGRLLQSKRSQVIATMRTSKARIDKVVKSIVSIESISELELRGRDIHDSLFILRFSNRSILYNNITLCDNVKHFSVEKDQNCENKTVLLWECTMENGAWIGGGRVMK